MSSSHFVQPLIYESSFLCICEFVQYRQQSIYIYIMLYCIYTDCTSGFWFVRSLKKKACLYSLLNRQEKKPT